MECRPMFRMCGRRSLLWSVGQCLDVWKEKFIMECRPMFRMCGRRGLLWSVGQCLGRLEEVVYYGV